MAKLRWLVGLGLGWALGGTIGALVGAGAGYLWDVSAQYDSEGRSKSTTPSDFAISLMVLFAAVLKADGKILKSELDYVKRYLVKTYGEEGALELLSILKEVLQKDIPVNEVCQQIKFNLDYSSKLQLIHLLDAISRADGQIHQNEINQIKIIANLIGLSNSDISSILNLHYDTIESAYKILEISSDASDEEVKKAYKKMAVKYHPDKVSHLGEEMQASANEKFKKVNEAYDKIKKNRGIK